VKKGYSHSAKKKKRPTPPRKKKESASWEGGGSAPKRTDATDQKKSQKQITLEKKNHNGGEAIYLFGGKVPCDKGKLGSRGNKKKEIKTREALCRSEGKKRFLPRLKNRAIGVPMFEGGLLLGEFTWKKTKNWGKRIV